MINSSPLPIQPRLIAALEMIESSSPRERDAAVQALRRIMPGVTLAQFVERVLSEAEEAIPWWQLAARGLLAEFKRELSPAGIKFCNRMRCRQTVPTSKQARDLRDLERFLRASD